MFTVGDFILKVLKVHDLHFLLFFNYLVTNNLRIPEMEYLQEKTVQQCVTPTTHLRVVRDLSPSRVREFWRRITSDKFKLCVSISNSFRGTLIFIPLVFPGIEVAEWKRVLHTNTHIHHHPPHGTVYTFIENVYRPWVNIPLEQRLICRQNLRPPRLVRRNGTVKVRRYKDLQTKKWTFYPYYWQSIPSTILI